MKLLRALAVIPLLSALAGCTATSATGCAAVIPIPFSGTLVSPAPNATGVAGNIGQITIQGQFFAQTVVVSLAPTTGGLIVRATDPLTLNAPFPASPQYTLAIPALAAQTTYNVTIATVVSTDPCASNQFLQVGSFTTR